MSEKDFRCPYCGSDFDQQYSRGSCDGCPFAGSCGRVQCPYCGTEFVPDSGDYVQFSIENEKEIKDG
mgnify:CR=1 FL=1